MRVSAPAQYKNPTAGEEKAYTTTTERKSFGELFWPQRKTFQAGGGCKNPIKTRKTISTTEIFPLWTPYFFLQKKFCTGAGRCMVINFVFKKIGQECRQFWTRILGVNFFGWPETLEKQGRKIRYQNSPSKFAEKFAGNFPKIRRTPKKNHPKSALHNVGTNHWGGGPDRSFLTRCPQRHPDQNQNSLFGMIVSFLKVCRHPLQRKHAQYKFCKHKGTDTKKNRQKNRLKNLFIWDRLFSGTMVENGPSKKAH